MYAHERVAQLMRHVGSRVESRTEILDAYTVAKNGAPHNALKNAQFWAKIERQVLAAVLDELGVLLQSSRIARVAQLRGCIMSVRDVVGQSPVSLALGLFDTACAALRRELYAFSYAVPADHHIAIVNTARAALAMPRDPLVLWDYMLEQLWLSAHWKADGESGTAQRLNDALITIFGASASSKNPPSFR